MYWTFALKMSAPEGYYGKKRQTDGEIGGT